MKNKENRSIRTLKSLVEVYIKEKCPVSSRMIISNENIGDVCSATIRSELFKLEQQGYIYQSHTSAGRTPTISGYRKYLEIIEPELNNIVYDKIDVLKSLLVGNYHDIPLSLHYVVQLLAKETDLLTFVAEPEISYDILYKLDVFKLSKGKLLFVICLASGMEKTIVVNPNFDITEHQLKFVVRYINDELSGMRIYDIQNKYLKEMSEKWQTDNKLLNLFMKEFYFALMEMNKFYIHFDSSIDFLHQPEFDTKDIIILFLNLMQRQDMLINIMQKYIDKNDYKVIIGEEFGNPSWSDFSLIFARYEIYDIPGFLGVIGPNRMDYKTLIPKIRDIAKTITEITKQGMLVPHKKKI